MEIALAHNNMDFDSLSAQYALTKLYPACRMVLGYPLTGNVRNFLVLNRTLLPIVQLRYVDPQKVSRVFLVDCQQFERLDDAAKKLLTGGSDLNGKAYAGMGKKEKPFLRPSKLLTLYDHHHLDPNGLYQVSTADSVIEPVGAATTLVVEKIIERKIPISPFDATVMAIGIYEDTGGLTYGGATARDANCIAYLLAHGADVSVVREYMRPRLEQNQIQLFEALLRNSQLFVVHGRRVVIAAHKMPEFVDGLATITRQLLDVEDTEAAFTLVYMRDRVHIVGRCDSRTLSVRDIVRQFGGDGHPGAGSAVVKGVDVLELVEKLKQYLLAAVAPQPVARDIMTTPVRTVRPDISMDEAGRLMIRYGLDGLIVSEGEKVVGVVSRRDIDQSTHHKLGHAKVCGFMSKPVISVQADASVKDIQKLMVAEDIGRLPVMDSDGALVGVVTRQDLLNSLFGINYGQGKAQPNTLQGELAEIALTEHKGGRNLKSRSVLRSARRNHLDIKERMAHLDPKTKHIMAMVGSCACSLNMTAYAVGGFVRDLLLGLPNYDLDFVIEGDAQTLAVELECAFPQEFKCVASHDRFKTATLIYRGDDAESEVDLSTARTEVYEYPAALPEVEPSRLEQDLLRRDFTINALAVCINPERFGELIDHFNGLEDLKRRIVRILHPFSFIEDPTRILRAVRFAGRFNFHLDAKSKEQAKRAIAVGDFDNLGGVRIKAELQMILESAQRLKSLNMLAELGANLRYLDAHLEYGDSVRLAIRRAERLIQRFPVDTPWVVYLGALLCELPYDRVPGVLERLHLANKHRNVIESGLELHRHMPVYLQELKKSEVYHLMRGRARESLAIAAAVAEVGTFFRRAIKLYLEELAPVKLSIDGNDLMELGVPRGPSLGDILNQVLAARLDGKISSREEELAFAVKVKDADLRLVGAEPDTLRSGESG
jgi:tRNA nucleotidyltransferase (CCA-adding enzyme)